MTSEEQEFGSIRYVYQPLLFIRLRSGRLAVAHGLTRALIEIIDDSTTEGHAKLMTFILAAATTRDAPATTTDDSILDDLEI